MDNLRISQLTKTTSVTNNDYLVVNIGNTNTRSIKVSDFTNALNLGGGGSGGYGDSDVNKLLNASSASPDQLLARNSSNTGYTWVNKSSGGGLTNDDVYDLIDAHLRRSSGEGNQVLALTSTKSNYKWVNLPGSSNGSTDLDGLSDVNLGTLAKGEALIYSGVTNKWVNGTEFNSIQAISSSGGSKKNPIAVWGRENTIRGTTIYGFSVDADGDAAFSNVVDFGDSDADDYEIITFKRYVDPPNDVEFDLQIPLGTVQLLGTTSATRPSVTWGLGDINNNDEVVPEGRIGYLWCEKRGSGIISDNNVACVGSNTDAFGSGADAHMVMTASGTTFPKTCVFDGNVTFNGNVSGGGSGGYGDSDVNKLLNASSARADQLLARNSANNGYTWVNQSSGPGGGGTGATGATGPKGDQGEQGPPGSITGGRIDELQFGESLNALGVLWAGAQDGYANVGLIPQNSSRQIHMQMDDELTSFQYNTTFLGSIKTANLTAANDPGGQGNSPAIRWQRLSSPRSAFGLYIDNSADCRLCEVFAKTDGSDVGIDVMKIIRKGNNVNDNVNNRSFDVEFYAEVTAENISFSVPDIDRYSTSHAITNVDVDVLANKLASMVPTYVTDNSTGEGSYQLIRSEVESVDDAFVTDTSIRLDKLTIALLAAFKSERAKRINLESQLATINSRLDQIESDHNSMMSGGSGGSSY